SPLRTILVNAIGVSADVGVEMAHVTLKRGDRLLLCSDGLHDYFPVEEEIAQKLSAEAPGDALKDMVELAKTRGGHDNITGVAVQVTDVIESVPGGLERDVTHPVDLQAPNPFASDEPTETAFVDLTPPAKLAPPPVVTERLAPSQLKATQPMRIVEDSEEDPATADTIPPGAKITPVPAPAPKPADGDAKPTHSELSNADTGPVRTQPDAKPAKPAKDDKDAG